MADAAAARNIFITGGTGFLGRALVPQLLDAGHDVSVLTRDPRRLPADFARRVRVVSGSLDDPNGYAAALAQAQVVVHAAKSDDPDPHERARRDVTATTSLLAKSIEHRVRRFIYISSISVYGVPADGDVDETAPRATSDDPYTQSKIRAEQIVLAQEQSLDVVILQPANIYGPGPCWWSGWLLDMMRRGRIILVNNGEGMANMVHVSDVAQAVRLAVTSDPAAGETFLVTDGQPITWRRYFEALEALVGKPAMLPLSASEAKAMSRRLSDRSITARTMRWMRRRLLAEPLVFPSSDEAIEKYAAKVRFDIGKIVRGLGYSPQYDLVNGMRSVELAIRDST
jgi:nucleoside-diphosphate-sugar epimerase